MGTHGYYVFKYKGKYYQFYNHYDSYPTGLGALIVEELNKFTDKKYDMLIKLLDNISNNEYMNVKQGFHYKGLIEALNNYTELDMHITDTEPSTDTHIKYVYIINIDSNIFTAKSQQFRNNYDLHNIPINWIRLLVEDAV